MARIGNVALSALVCLCLTTTMAPSVQASASAQAPAARASAVNATFAVSGVKVQADDMADITAEPGRQLAGRMAVLEVIGSKGARFELGSGVIGPDGRVRFRAQIAEAGAYTAQVRVVKMKTTLAVSSRFDIDVSKAPKGKQVTAEHLVSGGRAALAEANVRLNAGNAEGLAQTQATAPLPDSRVTRSGLADAGLTPKSASMIDAIDSDAFYGGIDGPGWSGFESGGRWINAKNAFGALPGGAALDTVKEGSKGFMHEIVSGIAGGIGGDIGGFALKGILGLIFPNFGENKQIAALSAQMQKDFSQVDQQLSAISQQLDALSQQLAQSTLVIQQGVSRANAAAAATNCSVMLSQANQYVTAIRDVQDNYADLTNLAWLTANLTSNNSAQEITAVGNFMFGQGSGNPQFLSPLNRFQQNVANLGALLTSGGPYGSGGIVQTCADAASTVVASNPGATWGPNGALRLGAADQGYFSQLQSITSYYSTYAALGQMYANFGAYLAIASMTVPLPSTSDQAVGLCAGVTSSTPGSLLTCQGLIGYDTQTTQAIQNAWNLTGASWDQVSFGTLSSDSRVNPTGTDLYITPAANVWVNDLANFGQGMESTQNTLTAKGYGPMAPLSGGNRANFNGSGNQLTGMSSPSWMGLNFFPANASAFERAINLNYQPCPTNGNCSVPQNMGMYMAEAGLLNGGAPAQSLILITGETSQAEVSKSSGTVYFGYDCYSGLNSYEPSTSLTDDNRQQVGRCDRTQGNVWSNTATGWAYVDTSMNGQLGSNAVIFNPQGNSLGVAYLVGQNSMNVQTSNYVNGGPYFIQQSGSSPCDSGCTATWTAAVSPNGTAAGYNYPGWNADFRQANQMYVTSKGATYGPSQLTGLPTSMTANGVNVGSPLAGQADMWPVLPTSGGNSVSNQCAMTQFTAGVSGSNGVPQVCGDYWQHYAAAEYGIDFGGVSASMAQMGTQQSSGNSLARVTVNNSSGTPQTVALTFVSLDGNADFIGGVPSRDTMGGLGSASEIKVNSCQADAAFPTPTPGFGKQNIICSVTVPPGFGVINLPINYLNGANSSRVVVSLTSNTVATSVNATLTNTPVPGTGQPGDILNLKATPGSQAGTVSLSWLTPTATPALTGYTLTMTTPDNLTSVLSIPLASVNAQAGSSVVTASVNLANTANPNGQWKLSLAGQNANGTGDASTVNVFLGSQTPTAVTNLLATVNTDGTLDVDWDPVEVTPVVGDYTVTITNPDGTVLTPVTVTSSSYRSPALGQTGTYQVSVAATNSLGTSPMASAVVTVTGVVPKAPANLDVSISATGGISAKWGGSNAVPAPTKYSVAIYGPDAAGNAIVTKDFPVTGANSMVNIPNFFRIGNDSKEGMYTLVVAGTNAGGLGETAQSSIYISQETINESTINRVNVQIIGSLPASFHALAAAQCGAGLWQRGYLVFGTCNEQTLTFTSAPGLPPLTLPSPLPGQSSSKDVPAKPLTPTPQTVIDGTNFNGRSIVNGKSVGWAMTIRNPGGNPCYNLATLSTTVPQCAQILNVSVDANGTLFVTVKNREAGNTTLTLRDWTTGTVRHTSTGLTNNAVTTHYSSLTDWFGSTLPTGQYVYFAIDGGGYRTWGWITLNP